METQIGKTICNWFEEFEKASGSSATEEKPRRIVFLINSSLPILSNYITTAVLILNSDRRLPAKALLRVSGELISRVLWVLNDNDSHEHENRLTRWIITSYRKANAYNDVIVKLYEKDPRAEVKTIVKNLQKKNDANNEAIDAFKKRGIKGLPQAQHILEQVFGNSKAAVGMYARHHPAIHPDILVLTNSVSEDGTITTFKGDTEESIDSLRMDCLTQAYAYFAGLCRYYGSSFKELADKYHQQYEELRDSFLRTCE